MNLSVSIERSAAEAYDFLALPEYFPKWASGLGKSLRRDGEDWIADTPEGPAKVRFSDRNSRGVLDHSVALPGGRTVFVPLRLVPKGQACELVLTLNRQPGVSEEKFRADAEWVMRDLDAAKRILEGYKRVSTEPAGVRVQAKFGDEVIADSRDALVMHEGSQPPVYYFPRRDVNMARLSRTSHGTYCPFKGQASYFSLVDGPENIAWSYEQPYEKMAAIRGLMAFYPEVRSLATQ